MGYYGLFGLPLYVECLPRNARKSCVGGRNVHNPDPSGQSTFPSEHGSMGVSFLIKQHVPRIPKTKPQLRQVWIMSLSRSHHHFELQWLELPNQRRAFTCSAMASPSSDGTGSTSKSQEFSSPGEPISITEMSYENPRLQLHFIIFILSPHIIKYLETLVEH